MPTFVNPTPEQLQEALWAVMEAANIAKLRNSELFDDEEAHEIKSNLDLLRDTRVVAVPEGHYVYTSRFKPGDEVWLPQIGSTIGPFKDEILGIEFLASGRTVLRVTMDWQHDEEFCFSTRAKAEAECEKRNAEKS